MEGNGTRAAPGSVLPAGRRCGRTDRRSRTALNRLRRQLYGLGLAAALALAARPSVSALDVNRLQQAAAAMGPRTERAAFELRELVARLQTLDDSARLDAVNSFVNRRVSFASDTVVWGVVDHWASPLEVLGRGQGDCEDYAIAKYFTLVSAGMPAAKLRLVYVRALLPASWGLPPGPQAHMVLAYYADHEAEPLILDNLMIDIRPASRRTDLTPVFSFNGEGLWSGSGTQTAGDPQARLSRWREVMLKARAEGFE